MKVQHRYRVTVQYTMSREIGIWANDEEDALSKAEAIVLRWDGVTDAEAIEAEEE